MPIVLKNVSHVYLEGTPYERVAIKNINLEIKKGELIAVIGHTGSGKSTLVQHLIGLLKPTRGEVTIDDINIHAKGSQAKMARRKVGMVFQYPEQQLFEETVYDDIAFGPRNLGLDAEETELRVKRALHFVGLDYEAFARRSPFRLSGGQMRRVAIAGVIALEPEYLILDEPSAGLDPRGRDEIFAQIMNLYHTAGITVVLVSHNMEDVARMAGRLLVMNKGTICLEGTPQEVFSQGQEILKMAGVDVPNVTALLKILQNHGLDVDESAITPEAATQTILQAVRRKKLAD